MQISVMHIYEIELIHVSDSVVCRIDIRYASGKKTTETWNVCGNLGQREDIDSPDEIVLQAVGHTSGAFTTRFK